MARKDLNPKVDRRQFLAGAIAAGAASAISAPNAVAAEPAKPAPRAPSALPPSAKTAAAESAIPLEITRFIWGCTAVYCRQPWCIPD